MRATWLLLAVPLWAVEGPSRVGVGPIPRRLTLAEAVELAVQNNLEIEIERSIRDSTIESVRGARGFYDPSFRWLPALQGSNGKLGANFQSQNFYFRQRLPGRGGQLSVDFENDRLATTSPLASLNPYVTSRLAVSFTQPLLRNRDIDSDRAGLQIRRKRLDLSGVDFELKAIDIVTKVEQAYWDVVAARQDAEVKLDSVNHAREQLARSERAIQAGALARVELSASEAELQRRLDSWYTTVGAVTEAENTLKEMLAADRVAPLWSEELIPVDERNPADPQPIYNLPGSMEDALRSRPELRVNQVRRQMNEIEQRANGDQVKPQINLVASYGSLGLGGSQASGVNPLTALSDPGFVTLSNLSSGRYQTARIGLAVDFTFRNSEARAAVGQSTIAGRRLKLEKSQIEQAIEAQVRNALQSIQTARQRIAAAQASERAAREKLDSETRLFQTGESTNFLVLNRQNEYADSRRRAVVANMELNKAVTRLDQAVGSTLRKHHITLK